MLSSGGSAYDHRSDVDGVLPLLRECRGSILMCNNAEREIASAKLAAIAMMAIKTGARLALDIEAVIKADCRAPFNAHLISVDCKTANRKRIRD